MSKYNCPRNLKNLKIGIIRRGPLDSTGEVIFSELFGYLKDRFNIEEVICSWDKRYREIDGKRPASSVITYHNKYLRDRQLLSQMPHYDLYHFHYPNLASLVRYRRPSIVTVHDLIPLHFPHFYSNTRQKITKRRLIHSNRADHIIAVSQYTKDDLVRLLNINPEKITVIYHGVNHRIYKKRTRSWARKVLGLPQQKRILLNVGTEGLNKNIERLIQAFYQLTKRFTDLLLIRVGSTTDSVTRLINELKISDRILRKGLLEKRPNLYYNAADLYICPEILGGFGLPNLEAMASGCPVVSSNAGSFPEVVGDAGLFFDPWDVTDICEKTALLLEDNKLRKEYAQKGLERAKLFSWKRTAEETTQVYTRVVRDYY